MDRKPRSFYQINALIIAAIIVVLLGVSLFINHRSNNKAKPAVPAVIVTAQANKSVNDFFTDYIKAALKKDKPAMQAVVKNGGTTKLQSYYKTNHSGADPILCASTVPYSYTTLISAKSSANDPAGSILMQEVINGKLKNISVTVVNDGGPKIDSINCNVPLSHAPPG